MFFSTGASSLTFPFFSSVQSLQHIWLFVTPWTAARQLPCPSPTPRACSDSHLSSWWFPSLEYVFAFNPQGFLFTPNFCVFHHLFIFSHSTCCIWLYRIFDIFILCLLLMRIRTWYVLYITSPAPQVMYSICSMMWLNDAAKDVHPCTLDPELTPGTADSSPSSHQHIIPGPHPEQRNCQDFGGFLFHTRLVR